MALTPRLAWQLLALTAALAVALRLADAIPGALTGLPRGTIPVRTFAALASAVPETPRLAAVPEHLDPQPALSLGRQRTARAIYRDRRSGLPALYVVADIGRDFTHAAAALPAADTLQTGTVERRGLPVAVDRVVAADGAVWLQARWHLPRSVVILRYRGGLDDLVRLVEGATTGERR